MVKKEDKRMPGIRKRVEDRMNFLNLSRTDLALKCGLSQGKYISDLLNGTLKTPPGYIWDLSVALNKSVRWIMTGEEEEFQYLSDFYSKYKNIIDAYEAASERDRSIVDSALGINIKKPPTSGVPNGKGADRKVS